MRYFTTAHHLRTTFLKVAHHLLLPAGPRTRYPVQQHFHAVKDEVFSSGVLGKGAAVVPATGELFAPVDGTIVQDDLGNGTLVRYKKDSFYWYKKVIASNGADM